MPNFLNANSSRTPKTGLKNNRPKNSGPHPESDAARLYSRPKPYNNYSSYKNYKSYKSYKKITYKLITPKLKAYKLKTSKLLNS